MACAHAGGWITLGVSTGLTSSTACVKCVCAAGTALGRLLHGGGVHQNCFSEDLKFYADLVHLYESVSEEEIEGTGELEVQLAKVKLTMLEVGKELAPTLFESTICTTRMPAQTRKR